jgi:hypothetical protein
VELTFGSYPEPSVQKLRAAGDFFSNPAGQTIARGLPRVLEALLEGRGDEALKAELDPVVRLRAVQEFTASEAVSFVFLLKESARGVPGIPGGNFDLFDRQVDRLALLAFDVYAACREKLYEIRLNEARRRVYLLERVAREGSAGDADLGPGPGAPGDEPGAPSSH